jgi:D-alanyl-D-alanine carboxypeptidase
MPARLAPIAAALALLVSLLVLPALGAAGARATGPLPACRYDDILTTPRAYSDWSITLVDTILRLPKGYEPPDLVPASQAGITGGGQVRVVMVDDLRAMTEAAAAAGNGIGIQSAYRSYAEQKDVFDSWVRAYGYTRALQVSARPGHSEHQLGLAIDFRSEPGGSPFTGTWNTTPAGKWMNGHGWEYGFVMSYPKGSMDRTCYDYEPWHYRYVGRPLAARIHASGLTPREYLWANFTTTVVPPAAAKTPAPGRTTAPTRTPRPSPTALPSPTPTPAPTATAIPATTVPLPSATASPSSTPAQPSPAPTASPGDGALGPGLQPVLLGGAALAGGALAVGAWLARRRGQSGAGL